MIILQVVKTVGKQIKQGQHKNMYNVSQTASSKAVAILISFPPLLRNELWLLLHHLDLHYAELLCAHLKSEFNRLSNKHDLVTSQLEAIHGPVCNFYM